MTDYYWEIISLNSTKHGFKWSQAPSHERHPPNLACEIFGSSDGTYRCVTKRGVCCFRGSAGTAGEPCYRESLFDHVPWYWEMT